MEARKISQELAYFCPSDVDHVDGKLLPCCMQRVVRALTCKGSRSPTDLSVFHFFQARTCCGAQLKEMSSHWRWQSLRVSWQMESEADVHRLVPPHAMARTGAYVECS